MIPTLLSMVIWVALLFMAQIDPIYGLAGMVPGAIIFLWMALESLQAWSCNHQSEYVRKFQGAVGLFLLFASSCFALLEILTLPALVLAGLSIIFLIHFVFSVCDEYIQSRAY